MLYLSLDDYLSGLFINNLSIRRGYFVKYESVMTTPMRKQVPEEFKE